MTKHRIDLGHGFYYSFTSWSPDRKLNPQYEGMPDIDPVGIIIWRLEPRQPDQVIDEDAPEGFSWTGVAYCYFDTPEIAAVAGDSPRWTLHNLDPLHLEPSIQMYDFPDGVQTPSYHGHIRGGRWEPC